MFTQIKNYFVNLNIFDSDVDDTEKVNHHRSNLIATRLYIVLMILALFIVALISWFSQLTTTIKIQNPTKHQVDGLPFDARCPCSQISISYGEFVSLQPTFHQICSSDFVSDRWINAIYFGSNLTYFFYGDFRRLGSTQFQALAGFCRFCKGSVQRNIALFGSSQLISPQVLSRNMLESQVNAYIKIFKMDVDNILINELALIREMTKADRLVSALKTNIEAAYFVSDDYNISMYITTLSYKNINGSMCTCQTTLDCVDTSNIYNLFDLPSLFNIFVIPQPLLTIPGLLTGCLPVTALLFSTLECFYNQTCVDNLVSLLPTIEKFQSMSTTLQSEFQSNSTIKSMLERMMVESWITNISYDQYFAQCAPVSCVYSLTIRHDILYIIDKVVSLIGGLTVVLGFVIPITIHYLLTRNKAKQTSEISLRNRLRQISVMARKTISELNIFQDRLKAESLLRYQLIATRIYLFLLVISISTVVFYSSLNKRMYREIIYDPTEFQYNQLEKIYSTSLTCPCTLLSINHSTFITMKPFYHQICSSDFITLRWLNYIEIHLDLYYPDFDYRVNAITHFKLLLTFCEQANKTIANALNSFMQAEYVGSQVIPKNMFESEIDSRIRSWRANTINNFLRTTQLLRATNRGNHLMNGNFDVLFDIDSHSYVTRIKPSYYENCSCGLSQSCYITVKVYEQDPNKNEQAELFPIPNFFVGCSPVEALLVSKLEYLYNQSFIRNLDQYMPVSLNESFNFSALNASLNMPNETIDSIVSRLMVDLWSWNISFGLYFDACAPSSCSYEYNRHNDIFVVVTLAIGVFGGFSIAFKLFLLIGLQFIEKVGRHFSRCLSISFIRNVLFHSDEHRIRKRLHVILVMITLCILCSFSTFKPESVNVSIEKPSFSHYQDLVKSFSDSLQCSCSYVSITYETFLSLIPRFHHVCSSEFVSNEWINYLYDDEHIANGFTPTNNRSSTIGQFQLLSAFCDLSQKAVNDSITQFLKNNFISLYLLSSNELDQRLQKMIYQFSETTPHMFITILSLIREMNGGNMMMSALSTSWIFTTPSVIDHLWTTHTEPLEYGQCSCGLSLKCVQPSRRMMIGCYPLESLLQSTLACLYDQHCIDPTVTFKAINSSFYRSSHFNMDTTIESILNELMVENYTSYASYEDYFNRCAPSSCSYSYVDSGNIAEAISNMLGIYGGLVIICRSIAAIIIMLLRHRIRAVNPVITQG